MAMIVRYITAGKKTAGHLEMLQSKGYDAKLVGDRIEVQASEVIEGEVNMSTPEAAREVLTEVTQKKAVFSYKTVFKFADGKELYSVPACTKLGKASCLVTKGEEKKNTLDDIFAAL